MHATPLQYPFKWVPFNTMCFCGATAEAKVPLRNLGGGGVWVLSINFPTTFQLSEAQGMSSISYLATEKFWELSDSRTHQSQQEMKVLSTLNKQVHNLATHNCRKRSFISELLDSPITNWPIFLPALWGAQVFRLRFLPGLHEGRKPKHVIVVITTGSFTLHT